MTLCFKNLAEVFFSLAVATPRHENSSAIPTNPKALK